MATERQREEGRRPSPTSDADQGVGRVGARGRRAGTGASGTGGAVAPTAPIEAIAAWARQGLGAAAERRARNATPAAGLRGPLASRAILLWTVLWGLGSFLLEIGYTRLGDDRPGVIAVAIKCVVYAVLWVPLLVTAVWLSDTCPLRWPIRRASDLGPALAHLVALIAAPVSWSAAAYYTCLALVPGWKPLGVGAMFMSAGFGVFYVYSIVVVLCHVVLAIRRHQAQEIEALAVAEGAAVAQLELLAMRLQPHFVGNALNTVSALLRRDPARARSALESVRDLLVAAGSTPATERVTLREELRLLRRYTEIQELRYGDRLTLCWEIPERLLDALVPAMVLQPVLENAVKFGIEARGGPGTIRVAARVHTHAGDGRDADAPTVDWDGRQTLCLEVTDDGVGLAPEGGTVRGAVGRGRGLGLATTRARLMRLFGPTCSVQLLPATPAGGPEAEDRTRGPGTTVRLTLPLHRQPEDPAGASASLGVSPGAEEDAHTEPTAPDAETPRATTAHRVGRGTLVGDAP